MLGAKPAHQQQANFLDKLPQAVIRNGRVIPVREDVANMLNPAKNDLEVMIDSLDLSSAVIGPLTTRMGMGMGITTMMTLLTLTAMTLILPAQPEFVIIPLDTLPKTDKSDFLCLWSQMAMVNTPVDDLLNTVQRNHAGPRMPSAPRGSNVSPRTSTARSSAEKTSSEGQQIATLQVKREDGSKVYIIRLRCVSGPRVCVCCHLPSNSLRGWTSFRPFRVTVCC